MAATLPQCFESDLVAVDLPMIDLIHARERKAIPYV